MPFDLHFSKCANLYQWSCIFFILFQHSNWKSYRQAVLQCIEQVLEQPEVVVELPSNPLINGAAWQPCVQALLQPKESHTDGMPLLFLLDDNFYYPSMRYEVYQLARKRKDSLSKEYAPQHPEVLFLFCFSKHVNCGCSVAGILPGVSAVWFRDLHQEEPKQT